jgi:adenylate kinase
MANEIKKTSNELNKITSLFTPEIVNVFAEISQSRSNYQIEKFVVNQHDTDEMRYVQTILEIQSIYYSVKHSILEMQKNEIKIKRLKSTKDEIDTLEAQQIELGMEQSRLAAIGTFRELKALLDILNTFPRYSRQQIEEGQKEYWHKRMHRQVETDQIGGGPSIAAHLNSLIQMGELQYVTKEDYKELEKTLTKEIKNEIL